MFDGHRPHLLGHQARQPFVQRHAQRADALGAKPERGGQHQVGAIRLQQIGGANVGLKAPGDQRHNVHERFGGLAAFGRQVADLFQSQDVTGSTGAGRLSHSENSLSQDNKIHLSSNEQGYDMNGQPRALEDTPVPGSQGRLATYLVYADRRRAANRSTTASSLDAVLGGLR